MQSRKNGQRNIWLLTGTGEGPSLASILLAQGWHVSVSVVSVSASWPYSEMPLTSLFIGPRIGIEGIKKVLLEAECLHEGFDWVVDATHPFAVEISTNLQKACQEVSQPMLRFERPLSNSSRTVLIEDSKDLSNYSLTGRNLLMALGARCLRETVVAAHQSGAQLFARVLPTPESFRKSLMSLVPETNLAVLRPLQGSHIGDFETALCRRWSISDVICRQSGGSTQKLWEEICQKENIDLWLITRPKLVGGVEVFHCFNGILSRIAM